MDTRTSGEVVGAAAGSGSKGEPPFISTHEGIGGWKAVHYWWNPAMDGFYEPWDTGKGRYDTEAEAIAEAMQWSKTSGIAYLPRAGAGDR